MDDNLFVRLYRLLLNLYPPAFRERLGEEMAGVFAEAMAEAKQQGRPALARLVLRELVHFPGSLLVAYSRSWQQLAPAPVNAPGWSWIAGWTVLSNAMLPLAYFLMPLLAVVYLGLLNLLPGPVFDPAVGQILGFVTAVGLVTAVVQWLLLRPHLAGAGWWIPLTVAGWLAGGLLAFFIIRLVDARVLGPAPIFLLVGATVGLAQWLLLRRILPGSSWWLPANLLASGALLLVGEAFESIAELVAVLMLPYLLTGALLWLLLQRASQVQAGAATKGAGRRPWRERSTRRSPAGLFLLGLLLVIVLPVGGSWAYAVAQLELAKRSGIYASPEAAIKAWAGGAAAEVGGKVEEIQMVVDSAHGDLSHVHFAGANVIFDRPPSYTDRRRVSTGTYYIRVEEGWVQVGEGAFPPLIGRLMEIYGLEGVGKGD